MNKLLIPLAAAAAIAAAVSPAAAQSRLTTGYVDGLAWKIDNAVQTRVISPGQGNRLHAELREAQPLAWRVQTGEARGYQRQRLDDLVADIEGSVNRYARYDAPRYQAPARAYGQGYGQGYGAYASDGYRSYGGWRGQAEKSRPARLVTAGRAGPGRSSRAHRRGF